MTEYERVASGLGREIDHELTRSDWIKEQREADEKLRTREDENDVAARRQLVLEENAKAEFPYSPKKIKSLIHSRKKDLEERSAVFYRLEMFGTKVVGYATKPLWDPNVDKQAIIKSMSEEAIHKQAFRIIEEDIQFQNMARRRERLELIRDFPKYIAKYTLLGFAVIFGLLLLGLSADLLAYLPHAPTVVAARRELSRLTKWLLTDAAVLTAVGVVTVGAVLFAVRNLILKITKDQNSTK